MWPLRPKRWSPAQAVLLAIVFASLPFSLAYAQTISLGWEAEWERTVAAAKKEGRVVVLLRTGKAVRDAVIPFERAYPEIKLEATGARGREITPRIRAEREAGQFLWDVFLNASGTGNGVFKPRGYLAPLQPALILPEVLATDKWLGGFNDGWIDEENRYLYGYVGELTHPFYVNRELMPESQVNSVEELINPIWKGKIIMDDPRRPGSGASHLGNLLLALGENWIRRFLANDPILIDNARQLAEFLYRGRYPVAMSLRGDLYVEFKKQGLDHVKPLAPRSEAGGRLNMSPVAGLFDRAPHPNAAKVFVNWFLTREAQQHFTDVTQQNSRRLDVVGPPETAPDPEVKYRSVDKGKYAHFHDEAIRIANEMLGRTR